MMKNRRWWGPPSHSQYQLQGSHCLFSRPVRVFNCQDLKKKPRWIVCGRVSQRKCFWAGLGPRKGALPGSLSEKMVSSQVLAEPPPPSEAQRPFPIPNPRPPDPPTARGRGGDGQARGGGRAAGHEGGAAVAGAGLSGPAQRMAGPSWAGFGRVSWVGGSVVCLCMSEWLARPQRGSLGLGWGRTKHI